MYLCMECINCHVKRIWIYPITYISIEKENEDDDEGTDREDVGETTYDLSMGVFEDSDDDDEDESDISESKSKKKPAKSANYGKIATAIGKMSHEGVSIVATDINQSKYTFSPDIDNNRIVYGLSGITKVGDEIVKQIMENRPYKNIRRIIWRRPYKSNECVYRFDCE